MLYYSKELQLIKYKQCIRKMLLAQMKSKKRTLCIKKVKTGKKKL